MVFGVLSEDAIKERRINNNTVGNRSYNVSLYNEKQEGSRVQQKQKECLQQKRNIIGARNQKYGELEVF